MSPEAAMGVASAPALSAEEFLRHNEEETGKWREFLGAHPEALDIKVELAGMKDVRGVVLHIFVVELLYGERLAGAKREKIAWEDFPAKSLDQLFSYHERAIEHFRSFLAAVRPTDWDEVLSFGTKEWQLKGSRRKMFVHTMLHSVRHWAQLATVLRQNGLKQDWQHDFILSSVIA
jgi:uncharacterized damage-inducible protein DinB